MNPRAGTADRRPTWLRPLLAATLLSGAATTLAALPGGISTASAALVYVLAVTAASAIGGLAAGLVASALSFLALNFFFTDPLHTFKVADTEDLVALVVFLLVSVMVGTLLSATVAQRARAEHREREALLLHHLSTRLLSGEPTREVLESFARAVADMFGLARCEIVTGRPGKESAIAAGTPRPAIPEGEPERFSMAARGVEVGHIEAVPPANRTLLPEERNVLRTFAGQMALALAGMRLAEEVGEARLEVERSRLRATLYSSVTHDLRTPLASITASATSLLGEDARFSAGDRRDLLETIQQQAERMNRLIGNLLDLSRLRAGALVPAKAPAAVEDVIEGVVARLQPMLHAHEVRLIVREDLPDVPMDVVQIDQVLTNLLENAAKFGPAGSRITVSASRWQGTVEVRVADQGPGIPAGERQRVFEPFIHGDGPGSGTGLGLAISRAIVESHGGTIRVEGAPGGGTAVLFQLPIAG